MSSSQSPTRKKAAAAAIPRRLRPTTAQGPRYGVALSALFHALIFMAALFGFHRSFETPPDKIQSIERKRFCENSRTCEHEEFAAKRVASFESIALCSFFLEFGVQPRGSPLQFVYCEVCIMVSAIKKHVTSR